jgi:site-specific recombinase
MRNERMFDESKIIPKHYNDVSNNISARSVYTNWNLNGDLSMVVKYIKRAGKKAGESASDDLYKCLWYLTATLTNDEEIAAKIVKYCAELEAEKTTCQKPTSDEQNV